MTVTETLLKYLKFMYQKKKILSLEIIFIQKAILNLETIEILNVFLTCPLDNFLMLDHIELVMLYMLRFGGFISVKTWFGGSILINL